MTQISQKLMLLIGGLFVGIFLAESIARLIRPAKDADLLFNSPDASPSGLYVLNKETRLIPAPNFSDTAKSLGYSVSLRTNSLSLRGPSRKGNRHQKYITMASAGRLFYNGSSSIRRRYIYGTVIK